MKKADLEKRSRDLVGRKFGMLTLISRHKGKHAKWLCECDCGRSSMARENHILKGSSQSCGCQVGTRTHEKSSHPLYRTWGNLKSRGTLCKAWNGESPDAFILCIENEIGSRPEGKLLKRIDPSKDFAPGNVEWRGRELTDHWLYSTWSQMVNRCTNPRTPAWKWYGARGISVCDQWKDSRTFIEWVEENLGDRPDGYSLDRIDNNGNYEPGNVRWADAVTQANNRRNTILTPSNN